MTEPGTISQGPQVRTFLYAHVIWSVSGRRPLLKRTLRKVLCAHLVKMGEEAGISVLAADGHDDHMHVLLRLHAVQHLMGVVRQLQSGSTDWLRGTRMVPDDFAWDEGFMAYSVSPSAVKQVEEYLAHQEQYHQAKGLDQELEVFEKAGTTAPKK